MPVGGYVCNIELDVEYIAKIHGGNYDTPGDVDIKWINYIIVDIEITDTTDPVGGGQSADIDIDALLSDEPVTDAGDEFNTEAAIEPAAMEFIQGHEDDIIEAILSSGGTGGTIDFSGRR